jgi:2-alkyl-3-oxoalkanoate reductase
MKTIALTGATGFVGSATLRLLLTQGHRVKALVRAGKTLPAHPRLELIPGKLNDPGALERLVADCAAVIHIAGAISGFDYEDLAATNVQGCRNLVVAMQQRATQARLIHVSSLAAREPQLSPYAASKRDGERIVNESELNWIIIRPPAVYGPEDPALRPLWQLLARGWLPRTSSIDARFSLLHVDDLASALGELAISSSVVSSSCCLHDGKPGGYGWTEIADLAAVARGKRVRTIAVPRWTLASIAGINQLGARLSGRRPPVLIPGKLPELAHVDWVCDNTQLPGCPDWKPNMQLKDSLATLPGWSQYR